MGTRSQALTVFPFQGGMMSYALPELIPPGYFKNVTNAEYLVIAPGTGSWNVGGQREISITKRSGTTKYNATAIAGTPNLTALSDFWRHGTSLSPTQFFVATAGTNIYADTALSGTWTSIKSAWGTGTSDVNITIAQGFAVFSNNNGDLPQKYDQTTVSNLNATYKFVGCTYHLRRLFGVGEQASADGSTINPSRSFFSAAGDITTYSGADSGNFSFDEDDADRLISVSRPLQQKLYFFKGPNKGSVHVLFGFTPATFQTAKVVEGLPAQSFKAVVTTDNDIYWLSNVGIHSLNTTIQALGNAPPFLSTPIQDVFSGLNISRLNQAVGFYHPYKKYVGWLVPSGSNTQNDTALVYNPEAQSWTVWTWSGFKGAAVMIAKTPSTGIPRLYVGGYDGFVYQGDQTTKLDFDATRTYTTDILTGRHSRLPGKDLPVEAQFQRVTSYFRPVAATVNLNVTIDGRGQNGTVDTSVGAGDLIGITFIIGVSKLADPSISSYAHTIVEDRGEGIQLEWTAPTSDFELYGYSISYSPAEGLAQEHS